MLQETTRPQTPAEQRLLRRRSTLPPLGTVFWLRDERLSAFFTACVVAILVTTGVWVDYPKVGVAIAGLFVTIRMTRFLERRSIRRHVQVTNQLFADELASGQVRSITCRPQRIIEREEFEDEGALWIFDGGDGRYLAICGQDFYETPRFPAAEFEVILGARHDMVIAIRSRSLRAPSTLVVKGDDIPWASFPERAITVFSAPPNADLSTILRCLAESTES